MNDPQTIEAVAAQWVRRKEFDDWNDAAENEFHAWLDASVLHRVAYLRLEEGWKRTERLAALRPAEFRRTEAQRPARNWTMLLRVAAAIVAIAVLGVAGQSYFLKPAQDTYVTPVGGREVLTLFDGSHIELNTDTMLRLSKNRRSATLVKGEAFFQIKHNENSPFVVTASGHRIVDLGTKFSVRGDADGKLEVSLFEGSARIENAERPTARAAVLKPGDIAVATAETLQVTRKPVEALTNSIGWRHGVVIFRHMALADAATEFNRYNLKKLVVDRSAAGITIDGTFATDNLETFARVARIALGLRVESREREIVITR
jgi:transmembrane sensor